MKILALVLVAQLCPTLGDPMDWSQPGSSVHGFSRQESWSGLLFPSPGDLPDPGIQPRSPVLLADILPSEPPWNISTRDSSNCVLCIYALNKFLFTRGTDSNLKKNYTSD